MLCFYNVKLLFLLKPKVIDHKQGLKCNFQGGGTVQLSGTHLLPDPIHFWGPCFNSGLSYFQIINHRLNVLSMISCFFQFCNIL